MRHGAVLTLAALLAVAGCAEPIVDYAPAPSSSAGPSSAGPNSSAARTYPGLFAEDRARFHPDHTDLGGRSNAELAQLLPSADAFPSQGRVLPGDVGSEDGSGLGLHGQTDGETRPAQCLYTPFGKTFSRTADGSDWNLYYAASQAYRAPDGSTITVTVNRQRAGSDVVALTTEWIKGCGAYQRAWPSFANPDTRTVSVRDTFGPGPSADGVPTYRYVSDVTPVDDGSASKPLAKGGGDERTGLARVRSIVLVVRGTGSTDQATVDRLLAAAVTKARAAR